MIDRINGWPARRLTVPNNARTYAMPLEAFPRSFGLICRPIWTAGLGRIYSATLLIPRATSRFVVTALAAGAGIGVGAVGPRRPSIRSLADLVAVDAAKLALTFFWRRNGQRKTGQMHNFARLMLNIAKH